MKEIEPNPEPRTEPARSASLPDALRRWSELRGEHPALVFPRDWRWSWCSWRQLQRRVTRDASLLEALPAGGTVAFPYRPAPEHLALDLALQATGRVPLPFTEAQGDAFAGLTSSWGADAWALVEGDEPRGPAGQPSLVLPRADPREGEELPPLPDARPASVRPWVGEGPEQVAQGTMVEAAAQLHGLLATGPERAIALVCGPLEELAERFWLAWGLVHGAALVLVPEPAATGWALYWARPMVACLPAALLLGVRGFLERQGRPRQLQRRLGRLRYLLAWGEIPAGEEAAWRGLGISLVPFPKLLRPMPKESGGASPGTVSV